MYIFKPARLYVREYIKKYAPYITGKVLDIGAGHTDRYSGEFKSTSEYIRMDLEDKKGVDVVGSIYKIPFPEDTFDSIVTTQVFEHLAHPQAAALELFRVMKRGAHAIVTVPQMNSLHEEPYDFFRYTNHGLRVLFEDAGFEILNIEPQGGYFSTLAQLRIVHLTSKYDLHSHPIVGRIVGKFVNLYGRYMVYKDSQDKSPSNIQHTIGWCIVLRK